MSRIRHVFVGLAAAIALTGLATKEPQAGATAVPSPAAQTVPAPDGGVRWEPMGGVLASGPAVASWGAGRLDVFAVGTDRRLWHLAFANGGWGGWEPLGGVLASAPAVASWGAGRLDVFAVGTDRRLWHLAFANGGWGGWEPLGGVLASGPAVASWGAGRLDVFAAGVDDQLWHMGFDGGRWFGWEPLGGVLGSAPAVASWGAGQLDVFASGVDRELWHLGFANGGWGGWEPLGGVLASAPAVASWGAGRLDVFASGIDGQLWHTWYDGGWPPAPVLRLVIDGTGNGHGRGLSQWGSFGWAVNYGRSWQQILGHYYGGTTLGGISTSTPIRVRLLALDNAASTGVTSTTRAAMWNGTGYGAVQAWEVGPNVYQIWASAEPRCPGTSEGWTFLQQMTGPVTFTTPWNQTATAAGDVLGLCQPNGSVIHYRGSITVLNDAAGANRTVNEVLADNYLRGVVPREVPASWGSAGSGRGMHALRAQAVAARSYGLSQGRYSYAGTCDSPACQVYGGSASRPNPLSPPTVHEHANTNAAVADTAGVVLRWPGGGIVAAEFSASNGPRTAGGSFPPVDDPADDVAGNPYHRWTRELDAAALAAHYGLGELRAAATERDPASPYDGIWGNRVRLQGTARTAVIPAWEFRNTWGFPSPGFVIRDVIWR